MRSVCTLAVIGCLMAAWVSTRADAVGRCVDGCVGPGLCGILGGVGIRKGPLAIMAAGRAWYRHRDLFRIDARAISLDRSH